MNILTTIHLIQLLYPLQNLLEMRNLFVIFIIIKTKIHSSTQKDNYKKMNGCNYFITKRAPPPYIICFKKKEKINFFYVVWLIVLISI